VRPEPHETGRKPVGLKTKVYLTDEEGSTFMGIGVLWLLQRIAAGDSMRRAAGEMKLSYAKAHRMIREAERGIGVPLLHRRRGGDKREGAELTGEAQLLIEAYDEMQRAIKSDAQARFDDFVERTGARLRISKPK
jgi:molybdate transport system regulatory protein